MMIKVDNKVIDCLKRIYLNEYFILLLYIVCESGIITKLVKPSTWVVLLHLYSSMCQIVRKHVPR